jgi:transcription elongation factor SPT5
MNVWSLGLGWEVVYCTEAVLVVVRATVADGRLQCTTRHSPSLCACTSKEPSVAKEANMLMDDEILIDAEELEAIMDDHPSTFVDEVAETHTAATHVVNTDQDNAAAAVDEGDEVAERSLKKARKEERRLEKEERRKHKKDKKSSKEKKASKFIDDAADEASEDDDDDDFVSDAEMGEDADYIKNHKSRRHMFVEGDEDLPAEKVAQDIEMRYNLSKSASRRKSIKPPTSSGAVDSQHYPMITEEHVQDLVPRKIPLSKRFSAAFLPRESDAKVFAVKCKSGMPRILVTRIVNKCYHFRIGRNDENKKLDLGILSVFALEHSKEYIYVESYRQLFVEQALTGLVGLYRFNIKMVDPNELMQLMEPRPLNKAPIRVGMFVRIRSHKPYQGDLAQVLALDADGKRATVKMVPREDFVDKSFTKPTMRHPQRFFNPAVAVGSVEVDGGIRWGDAMFDQDGYIIKIISLRGLMCGDQMVAPNTEELAYFLQRKKDQITIAAGTLAACGAVGLQNSQREYKLGEVVRVVSGQLANAVGTIVDVTLSSNTVKIACRIPGRPQPLEVRAELSNCERHFIAGNHIGVEQGPFQGRTGTVVKVISDGLLAVLGDGDATEFEVRSRDCRQSRLVSTARHSLGAWKLFDLVMVGSSAGCIVRCSADRLDVLTTDNAPRTITPSEVTKVVRGASRPAVDGLLNTVSRGAVVTIKSTNERMPPSVMGVVGSVEQLFDQTLFVRCPNVTDHSGIVAIPSSLVQLVGGKTNTKRTAPAQHLAFVRAKGHYASKPDGVHHVDAASEQWDGHSEFYPHH